MMYKVSDDDQYGHIEHPDDTDDEKNPMAIVWMIITDFNTADSRKSLSRLPEKFATRNFPPDGTTFQQVSLFSIFFVCMFVCLLFCLFVCFVVLLLLLLLLLFCAVCHKILPS